MSVPQVEFSRTVTLPPVNTIHQVVEAFARTSDHGSWQKDAAQSDPFQVIFTRGNWGTSMLGFGKKRVPLSATESSEDRSRMVSRPARLKVGIRPSPKSIRIVVDHTVYFRDADFGVSSEVRDHWAKYTLAEVDAMRGYMKEFYDLPDLPLLEDGGKGAA
jgi:hypothetical protein